MPIFVFAVWHPLKGRTSGNAWIDRVDVIAIELHDDGELGQCSTIFLSSIAGQGIQFSHSGELTICKRRRV
jgi:hypothetical protein